MSCNLCGDELYYMNANGDWILCPRCDIIRLAKALEKKSQ